MTLPAHVFREYDIRGVADAELGDELASRIGGHAAAMRAQETGVARPRFAVARDCRLSSERLHRAVVAGLGRAGADVVDVGVGPTPLLYFAAHHLGADGGVMVTGSHNPAEENGFKIVRARAASFFGDDIRRLRDRVLGGAPAAAPTPGGVTRADVSAAYVARLAGSVDLGGRRVRAVVDAGNGAAGPVGLAALRAAGIDPDALYCEMDGRFPNHHPDPTVPRNLEALVARVQATSATVGLAWDGDGDRLGVVDATGEIVWGDRLLILFSRDLLRERPGAAILGEVKCSQTLYDDIASHGGRGILWKTGHSLIKAKMKEEGALLAGEMSGHFFFADRYLGYDDGIYAALRVAEILARTGRTVVDLLADVPRTFATPEIRVRCPDAAKFEVVARVRERYRPRHRVVDVDGARILFDDGAWGLVRASNTGPILVLRFEAPTEARLEAIRREVEAAVEDEARAIGA